MEPDLYCIQVARLQKLLEHLQPDDVVTCNFVGNLNVFRQGNYVGYVEIRWQGLFFEDSDDKVYGPDGLLDLESEDDE